MPNNLHTQGQHTQHQDVAAEACLQCRIAKRKCDENKPCSRCVKKNLECISDKNRTRIGRRRYGKHAGVEAWNAELVLQHTEKNDPATALGSTLLDSAQASAQKERSLQPITFLPKMAAVAKNDMFCVFDISGPPLMIASSDSCASQPTTASNSTSPFVPIFWPWVNRANAIIDLMRDTQHFHRFSTHMPFRSFDGRIFGVVAEVRLSPNYRTVSMTFSNAPSVEFDSFSLECFNFSGRVQLTPQSAALVHEDMLRQTRFCFEDIVRRLHTHFNPAYHRRILPNIDNDAVLSQESSSPSASSGVVTFEEEVEGVIEAPTEYNYNRL